MLAIIQGLIQVVNRVRKYFIVALRIWTFRGIALTDISFTFHASQTIIFIVRDSSRNINFAKNFGLVIYKSIL